jgi:sugar lactone lactonase YvrE
MVNDSLGNIYIADTCNNVIKKKDSRGVLIIAGSLTPGYIDGIGTSARFYNPCGICIDSSNNLYIADTVNNCIRKINNTNTVSTISTGFNGPCGICIDLNRNLYIVIPKTALKLEFWSPEVPRSFLYCNLHIVIIKTALKLQFWSPDVAFVL